MQHGPSVNQSKVTRPSHLTKKPTGSYLMEEPKDTWYLLTLVPASRMRALKGWIGSWAKILFRSKFLFETWTLYFQGVYKAGQKIHSFLFRLPLISMCASRLSHCQNPVSHLSQMSLDWCLIFISCLYFLLWITLAVLHSVAFDIWASAVLIISVSYRII